MASATPRSSTSSSSRALNGASRSTKRSARRMANAGGMSQFISRESAAIARRAGDLYSSTRAATRNHPIAAVGVVMGVAALLGGLWYAARKR
jgi:hypothetical protein